MSNMEKVIKGFQSEKCITYITKYSIGDTIGLLERTEQGMDILRISKNQVRLTIFPLQIQLIMKYIFHGEIFQF